MGLLKEQNMRIRRDGGVASHEGNMLRGSLSNGIEHENTTGGFRQMENSWCSRGEREEGEVEIDGVSQYKQTLRLIRVSRESIKTLTACSSPPPAEWSKNKH